MQLINSLYNCFYPEESSWPSLPKDALTRTKLEPKNFKGKIEFRSTSLFYKRWTITVFNHTDFEIRFNNIGFVKLDDKNVFFDGESYRGNSLRNRLYEARDDYKEEMIAYCMEGYPELFFFEMKDNQRLTVRKYMIDVSDAKGRKVIAYPVKDEIAKASEWAQQRKKFRLILMGAKDPESSFYGIPRDILGCIAHKVDLLNVCKID